MSDVDISNMGRCVVCGKPIDMRDSGDELAIMETPNPDHAEFDKEDVRSAMANALRRDDAAESHTLATAYEDGKEIVMHERCHDNTALPELYSNVERP